MTSKKGRRETRGDAASENDRTTRRALLKIKIPSKKRRTVLYVGATNRLPNDEPTVQRRSAKTTPSSSRLLRSRSDPGLTRSGPRSRRSSRRRRHKRARAKSCHPTPNRVCSAPPPPRASNPPAGEIPPPRARLGGKPPGAARTSPNPPIARPPIPGIACMACILCSACSACRWCSCRR